MRIEYQDEKKSVSVSEVRVGGGVKIFDTETKREEML